MSSYQELNKQLAHLLFAKKSKLDCQPIANAFHALNLPLLPYIHVAGTNGKGSVCEKISQTFTHAGYRCGKYTSPHISSFRERIQIDGQLISPQDIEQDLPPLLERFPSLTFFEIMTLLAFVYFARMKVDVAVIEVGLGGRLDATNCIQPRLSIITSIGWDHQHILGDTLEKIALEKGGIIKEGVPVILGPTANQKCLKHLVAEKKTLSFKVEGDFCSYDQENQAIAKRALEYLQDYFTLTKEAIGYGLKAKPPCRQEVLRFKNHQVILDMSHNPPGMAYLFKSLKAQYSNRSIIAFVSFSEGHDAQALASIIEMQCDKIYLLDLKHPRLLKKEFLKQNFTNYEAYVDINQAKKALKAGSTESLYLFVGSLYMMQEVRTAFSFQEMKDPILIQDGSFNFR